MPGAVHPISGDASFATATLSYPAGLNAMTDGTALMAASGTPTASGLIGAVTYWLSGSVPTGIAIGSDGVISGTPEATAKSYAFTVTATDSVSNSASVTVTAAVAYPAASLSYADFGTITAGSAYTSPTPATSGLYGAVTYTLASGNLPQNLTLNPSTGAVFGTPNKDGTYSFAIRATDSIGNSATSAAISGSVGYSAITLSYPSGLNAMTDGTAISADNGTPSTTGLSPVTYTVSGAVPTGVSVSSSGIVSGTPEATSGTYTFTVTATDAVGNTQSDQVTTVVSYPAASISYAALGTISAFTSYTSPAPTASGLYGAVTYTSAGSLPSGLSLSRLTGVLSGTAGAGAAYGFTVTATDSIGNAATTANISGTVTSTTPAAFSIPAVGNAAFSTLVSSSPVTLTGFNTAISIAVTGDGSPQISLDGTTWVSGGTIQANVPFVVRLTSASAGSTSETATVTAGGVSASFVVTTATPTTVPSAFSIPATGPEPVSTMVVSSAVTLAGFNTATSIAVSGDPSAQISLDNTNTWVTSGTIQPNASFLVRMTSASAEATASTATVTAGGVSANWVVTTQDTTPATFSIPDSPLEPLNSTVTSSPVTLGGFDTATAITVTGASGNPQISLNGGYSWVSSGQISDNSSFKVRLTTPGTQGTPTVVTVTAGGVSATWTVTTENTTPAAFASLGTVTGAAYSTQVSSSSVAPTGYDTQTTASVSGTCTPQIAVNGGSWTDAGTSVSILPTQAVRVRVSTPAYQATCTAVANVGGTTSTFSVSTVPATLAYLPGLNTMTDGTAVTVANGTPAVTGLLAPVSYQVTGGSMPYGLSMAASTGVITGTPEATSGGYQFTVIATDAAANTASYTVNTTVTYPAASISYAALGTITSGSVYASPTPTEAGLYGTVTYATPTGSLPPGLSFAANGAITGTPTGDANYSFTVLATDSIGNSATTGTISGTVTSTTPSAFSIAAVNGAAVSTVTRSAAVTLGGFNAATPISVSGQGSPQISLDGGSTWVSSGTISSGSQFLVELTSASAANTAYTATVTAGGVSAAFVVTTTAPTTTPTAFSIPAAPLEPLDTTVTSAAVTLAGFNTATAISVSGASGSPQISLDGGATWVTSGSIQPNGSFEVSLLTPNTQATVSTATVTAGGVSATWTVTTENMTPSAFSIPAANNADPSVLVSSSAVQMNGFDTATSISVAGQGSPQISLDGSTWVTSGTIQPSASFWVRLTSSSSYSTALTATVTAGGVAGNFVVTTAATPASISYSTSLNSLVAGTSVSVSPAVAGMTSPISYNLVGTNQPPTGMSLASTGGISGTPTTAGTYTYTVQATDKNSVTATVSITSVVAGTLTYSLPTSLPVGQAYISAAPQAVGVSGITTWALASGSLPPGMTLDSDGTISGSPTTTGTSTFAISGTNGTTQTAYSPPYTMSIGAVTASLSYPSLASTLTAGVGFSTTPTPVTSGLTAPITYAKTGTMPTPLMLQASNGQILYTPSTAGNFTFTVTATDTNHLTASTTITELVNGTLAYAMPASLSTAQTYSFVAPTVGGNMSAITSWTISSGALPNGLQLNANGTITGTPTTAGPYSFTVGASNATQTAYSPTYSGTVVNSTVSSLSYPTLASTLTAGVGFSTTPTPVTSGLTAPITYTKTGTMPTPMQFASSSNGDIINTPTTAGSFTFTVTATDANNVTASTTITELVNGTLAYASIPTSLSTAQGYSIPTPTAYGIGTITSYSISSGTLPNGLQINASNGTITGTPTAVGPYSFTVKASNATQAAYSPTYSGTVVNTAVSSLSYPTLANPLTYASSVSANPVTGGLTAPITYAKTGTLPSSGVWSNSSGAITGTAATAGNYSFTITATDANGTTATANMTDVVTGTVSYGALASELVAGTAYSTSTPLGGTPTLGGISSVTSWTVSSGALPAGMSINSNGLITGTPNTTGTYSFVIEASNTTQTAYSPTYTVSVQTETGSIFYSNLQAEFTSGSTYFSSLPTVSGVGTISGNAYTVSGALPTGMSVSETSGGISGTPTTAGTGTYTVTVTGTGGSAKVTLYAVVNGTLAYNLPSMLSTQQSYTSAVPTSGGNMSAITSWTVSSGALPPGMMLNPNGSISGTPTAAGDYTFTVSAANGTQTAYSPAYSITVESIPAATLSYSTAPLAVGGSYNLTPSPAGLAGSSTYALTSGTVPSPMTFSTSNGYISGGPATAGTYPLTITATDSNSNTATQTFSLVVNGTLTYNLPTTLSTLQSYASAAPTVAGNMSAITSWTISSGALPPGMKLNSNGSISGTPTAIGPYTFTVSAANGTQTAYSPAYSITVESIPAATLSYSAIAPVTHSHAIANTNAVTSGLISQTFTTLGTLPTGVTVSHSSGQISGTPSQAGTYNFTVVATDTNNVTVAAAITIVVN